MDPLPIIDMAVRVIEIGLDVMGLRSRRREAIARRRPPKIVTVNTAVELNAAHGIAVARGGTAATSAFYT